MILGKQVGAVEVGEYRALTEGTATCQHNVHILPTSVEGSENGKQMGSACTSGYEHHPGVNLGQVWVGFGTRRVHILVTKCQPNEQVTDHEHSIL